MTTKIAQEAESRIRLTNSRRRGTGLQEKKSRLPGWPARQSAGVYTRFQANWFKRKFIFFHQSV